MSTPSSAKRANHPLSRIEYQVMWNRLISVVEEQAQTLVRTAFGTATREAGDLSAGVYDTKGRMLAQAVTGTPGHVNSMAMSTGYVLDKVPITKMNEGDAFIVNDPWQGTGHLNDIVIVTPTFRRGKPVGLFACTLHVVDIGGRGIIGEAKQVYEEGIYLPITKIVDRGEMNEWLIDIIKANVREPIQVIGDIYSEIASNEVGGKRLVAMMDEFGLEHLDDLAKHILDHSREASLEAINRLPHGTYHNSMMVDGINGKPMELKAKLTIGPEGIDVDFAGSAGVVQLGINVPLCYTEAYTSFGVKCIVAPHVPNNAASLATIRVTAPEGCILNAKHPAPVAGRSIIGQMLPDVVFGCLQQAMPEGVPAEGTSCLWNVRLMGGMGRVDADPEKLKGATPYNVTGFHSGGTGARPKLDGLSATAFPSGVRNVPVEITETNAPVLVWSKEYRQDSGGAGEFRGGLGQVMEIETAEDMPFAISTSFDRVVYPPRGRAGGKNGTTGRVETRSGRTLPPKAQSTIAVGDRLIVSMPGGGGYGDPHKRPAGKVADDVARGLVSVEAAREHYGVAVDADGVLDAAETARLRTKVAAE
ncbi:hydantoinase B/oxoprolinase family protein [Reyranella sp.]|uniref:hydantoinase B/oxoprolinase family protein n=1 Tax=Reyranella sp. TaxID=1929291 RepID=UPI003D12F534